MPIKKLIAALVALAFGLITNAQNNVSTYAGTGYAGASNGWVDTCSFNHPFGICRDNNNNIYVADGDNNCIRKINTSTGTVSTLAGTGKAGWKDGQADTAQFQGPIDVCADDSGNIYVSDFGNQCIRKISYTGTVSTIAGSHTATPGYKDGAADTALFQYPRGICRDANGNLYIGDSWNHRIRQISAAGIVSTYAGGGISGLGTMNALLDGNDTSARFNVPCGLSIDTAGNIYVADAYNHRIRKIDVNRMVTTVGGTGPTGEVNGGFADGDSAVARFNTPTELYADGPEEKIYVSDLENNRIRLIDLSTYAVSTFAGSGQEGYDDEVDSLAAFDNPRGITMTSAGSKFYVADYNNNVIRLIEPANATGIKQSPAAQQLSVYPDPFTNEVNVVNLPTGNKTIQLFDATGRKLQEWQTSAPTLLLNLATVPPGNYLLQYITPAHITGSSTLIKN